jgi:hypothetical protein
MLGRTMQARRVSALTQQIRFVTSTQNETPGQ